MHVFIVYINIGLTQKSVSKDFQLLVGQIIFTFRCRLSVSETVPVILEHVLYVQYSILDAYSVGPTMTLMKLQAIISTLFLVRKLSLICCTLLLKILNCLLSRHMISICTVAIITFSFKSIKPLTYLKKRTRSATSKAAFGKLLDTIDY